MANLSTLRWWILPPPPMERVTGWSPLTAGSSPSVTPDSMARWEDSGLTSLWSVSQPNNQTGGYWEVATDGGIFAFGAPFFGSTGAITLNKPVNGMTPSANGHGYWFVASDGGIFAFGDAQFHGSIGGSTLNSPVVGMATDNATGGYWLVGGDGGIFVFGAPFYGRLTKPDPHSQPSLAFGAPGLSATPAHSCRSATGRRCSGGS